MIKHKIQHKTLLKVNNSVEGETIEMKVERIMSNKEPITDSSEIIYTDRKDGVRPDYDIRTDRWEFAIDGMDKVTKAKLAKRDELYKSKENQNTDLGGTPMQVNGQSPANSATT